MASAFDYLNLFGAHYKVDAKYMAWAEVLLQGQVDAQNVVASFPRLFDLDNAVGEQLDKTGQWIGLTRYVREAQTDWFSWDTPGLGWDEGQWYSPYVTPGAAVVRLDDTQYRTLLRARVAANYWDGTIEGAYAIWDKLFAGTGFYILIQNNNSARVLPDGAPDGAVATGNMHIIVSLFGPPVDPLTEALFLGGYILGLPAGVTVDAFLFQSESGLPMFAFDVGPDTDDQIYTAPPVNLAGWDIAYWGVPAELLPGTALPAPGYNLSVSFPVEVETMLAPNLRVSSSLHVETVLAPNFSVDLSIRVENR